MILFGFQVKYIQKKYNCIFIQRSLNLCFFFFMCNSETSSTTLNHKVSIWLKCIFEAFPTKFLHEFASLYVEPDGFKKHLTVTHDLRSPVHL